MSERPSSCPRVTPLIYTLLISVTITCEGEVSGQEGRSRGRKREERRLHEGESEGSLAALPSGGPALNLQPSRGRQRDTPDRGVGGAGGPFMGRVELRMITRCCEERKKKKKPEPDH